MAQDKLMTDLLGKNGAARLRKSINGASLDSYIACRAAAAWFSKVLEKTAAGEANYLPIPGSDGSSLYVEKTKGGKFRAELIKSGKVQYRFSEVSGDQQWQKDLAAVPFTVLSESGVKVEQSYAREVPQKLNQAIDSLVELQLAKAIKEKEFEGDPHEDGEVDDPGMSGQKRDDRIKKDPSRIKEGMSLLEIDSLCHEEAKPNEKPLKGKAVKKDEQHLSKPPVSQAQRAAMHAAAEGHSTLGIPKSVGKEFSDADQGGKLPEHKKMKKAGPLGQWHAKASKPEQPEAEMNGRPMKLKFGKPKDPMLTDHNGRPIKKQPVKKFDPPAGSAAPKMPSAAKPASNKPMPKGNNPKPAAVRTSAPKMPTRRAGIVSMGMGMGKSETFTLTEAEAYRPCMHCGVPEFKKSEDGTPKFTPCACFASEGRSIDTGKPQRFCSLAKSADGSMKLSFDKRVDPEAKRLFLLLLKGTLLSSKVNQE